MSNIHGGDLRLALVRARECVSLRITLREPGTPDESIADGAILSLDQLMLVVDILRRALAKVRGRATVRIGIGNTNSTAGI